MKNTRQRCRAKQTGFLCCVYLTYPLRRVKGEGFMVSGKVTVLNQVGIHLRPAERFCTKALEFSSKITICKGTGRYNAKSVISVLSACVKYGEEMILECDGKDEEQALKALETAVMGGLGEQIIPLEQEKVM